MFEDADIVGWYEDLVLRNFDLSLAEGLTSIVFDIVAYARLVPYDVPVTQTDAWIAALVNKELESRIPKLDIRLGEAAMRRAHKIATGHVSRCIEAGLIAVRAERRANFCGRRGHC